MFKFGIFCGFLLLNFACFPPKKFEPIIPKDEAVAESSPIPKDAINIRIKEDGSLFLENEEVGNIDDTTELKTKLKNLLNNRNLPVNSKCVMISASAKIRYKNVVILTDLAKELGAEPIGIQVEQ